MMPKDLAFDPLFVDGGVFAVTIGLNEICWAWRFERSERTNGPFSERETLSRERDCFQEGVNIGITRVYRGRR